MSEKRKLYVDDFHVVQAPASSVFAISSDGDKQTAQLLDASGKPIEKPDKQRVLGFLSF